MGGDPFAGESHGERPLLSRRYRIGALVGRGGMAEVYRAYDMQLERPVAVKRFTSTDSAIDLRRFDDEARLLGGLTHPGLVAVYDAGEDAGSRYLVMQLVNGPSLHLALTREPPTVDEVLALGHRLLDTLAYVHRQGVIHRDVKPSNILIDLEGEAYLTDFGLARLADTSGVTPSGEIVGTAAYLAPEQVRGEPATTAIDVYALGLVLLQCLTGQQEFEGPQAEAALARLTRDPVIPDWIPGPVRDQLAAMTSYDPARRPTAEDCAHRWAALIEPSTAPMAAPMRRPTRRAVAVASAGLLSVGLWLSAVLLPTTEDPAPPRTIEVPPLSGTPTTTSPVISGVDLAVRTQNQPTTSQPTVPQAIQDKPGKKGKPPKHK